MMFPDWIKDVKDISSIELTLVRTDGHRITKQVTLTSNAFESQDFLTSFAVAISVSAFTKQPQINQTFLIQHANGTISKATTKEQIAAALARGIESNSAQPGSASPDDAGDAQTPGGVGSDAS